MQYIYKCTWKFFYLCYIFNIVPSWSPLNVYFNFNNKSIWFINSTFQKVFIYDLSRLICVHYIKVDGGSRSISKDAPKFLNQITSPHRKTNRTQRPFIKVKQYILKKITWTLKSAKYKKNLWHSPHPLLKWLFILPRPLFVPFYIPHWLEVSSGQERRTLCWQKPNTHTAKTIQSGPQIKRS